jgi:hypothetical protein
MELALLIIVALGLGGFALARRTRGRIIIVWGERWSTADEGLGEPALRVSSSPATLMPSPWERELQRRLQRRVLAPPPRAAASGAALEVKALGEGRYRLLPPARSE